ncbi:MAG: PEP-CTERM sorting domain-containing protein [Acidobacteria bacterium]|nr:PEP-CTERM sorting domain-containing protein [Acidobacteriota bacterium]
MRRLLLVLFLALAAFWAPCQGAILYDLETDWSFASNPNGAWTYRAGVTPLGWVQADWGGTTGSTFWATTQNGTVPPAWGQVGPANAILAAQLGDIVGHSSTNVDTPGNVLWTSPGAGLIDISGQAWNAYHAQGRDDSWFLYVNNVLVASRSSVLGVAEYSAAANFLNNLAPAQSLNGWAVNAGDTVRFDILRTTELGHFVGVDLSISYQAAQVQIPEPATCFGTLSGLGLLGVAAWRRRRAR